MKHLILVSFFCLGLTLKAQQASELKKDIQSNTSAIEWSSSQLEKDDKTGFITGAQNDEKNLYLVFQTTDPRSISKILAAGMSLSLKAKTKPKLNAKLDYPLEAEGNAVQGQSRLNNNNRQGQQTQQQRRKAMTDRLNTIISTKIKGKLKGFQTTNGKIFVDDISSIGTKIEVLDNSNEPTFNYEIRIPFNELFPGNYDLEKLLGTEIAISFLVKPISSPASRAGGSGVSRGGGRGGGRGAGRRGAGGGRGTGATSSGPTSDMNSAQTVKFSYTIKK